MIVLDIGLGLAIVLGSVIAGGGAVAASAIGRPKLPGPPGDNSALIAKRQAEVRRRAGRRVSPTTPLTTAGQRGKTLVTGTAGPAGSSALPGKGA